MEAENVVRLTLSDAEARHVILALEESAERLREDRGETVHRRRTPPELELADRRQAMATAIDMARRPLYGGAA